MVYIKRRERETTGALLRRFVRRVQQSGILLESRKGRVYRQKPTKRVMRERALRRNKIARERLWLEKLGKLEEERR